MIDLDASETAALLALIDWQAKDGATLPCDAQRDADLRRAARKLARPAPATKIINGARKATERTVEERTLLLAWLTQQLEIGQSHLVATINADSLFPWVVCIHVKSGSMTWRISDIEASAYFGHLKRQYTCDKPNSTREDKLTRLAALVTRRR